MNSAATYTARTKETGDLLKAIAAQLATHKRAQAADPANWGHAADLGRINEALAYVLADLGDLSAVEAKGLEY